MARKENVFTTDGRFLMPLLAIVLQSVGMKYFSIADARLPFYKSFALSSKSLGVWNVYLSCNKNSVIVDEDIAADVISEVGQLKTLCR